MSYRATFDATIHAVLAPCGSGATHALWPEALAEEGVAYGQEQQLDAEEAATWYLSAAALIRMQEGDLGVPLASRLLRQARREAEARGLSLELRDALARMERERHEWIAANHERQGAALRALRPLPETYAPEPDWPDLLERLLSDAPG